MNELTGRQEINNLSILHQDLSAEAVPQHSEGDQKAEPSLLGEPKVGGRHLVHQRRVESQHAASDRVGNGFLRSRSHSDRRSCESQTGSSYVCVLQVLGERKQ